MHQMEGIIAEAYVALKCSNRVRIVEALRYLPCRRDVRVKLRAACRDAALQFLGFKSASHQRPFTASKHS